MSKFDSLNDTFNTDDGVEVDAIVKAEETNIQKEQTRENDVNKDYDYTRGNLYSLIEKGQEAINGIMEVAGETASPRAYEVAGQLIKSVATTHVAPSSIDILTAADDLLVEPDDDFGFNGNLEVFNDSRSFSPTQQKDI